MKVIGTILSMAAFMLLTPVAALAASGDLNSIPAQSSSSTLHRQASGHRLPHGEATRSARQAIRPAARIRLAGKYSVAEVKSKAISRSLQLLVKLKPYVSDYGSLRLEVRAYWANNIRSPNVRTLTNLIMRHVKSEYRTNARGKVIAYARDGVRQVKAAIK